VTRRQARAVSAIVVALVCTVSAACGSTVPVASRPAAHVGSAAGARDQSLGASSESTASEHDTVATGVDGRPTSRLTLPPNRSTSGRSGVTSPPATGPANHSPVTLGVLYTVNDGAESAGINNGNGYSLNQVMHAFVDSYNANGGIGGRHIDAVYAELHSAGNDYEGALQAVCATFTQDHHVAAVIADLGYHSDILVSCLAKANVPLITGDWDAPDQQDAAKYPLFVTPIALVGDTRVNAVVSHLAASGFLQAKNRVGAIVEDCPVDERVYQDALVPAVRRAGLTLAATYRPRCFQSIQDYGGQASDIQGAVLQFNRAGVDRVIVVSEAAEANVVNLFAQGADAQHYLPGYALSSVAAPSVLALNVPASQLANMQGVGWLPSVDTQNSQQSPPTSTGSRCVAQLAKQGLRPTSNADYTYLYGACDSFAVYEAALRATNGDTATSAVMRALAAIGRSYVAASTVNGQLTVDGNGRIGAATGRLFAWVGGKFQYTSGAFRL